MDPHDPSMPRVQGDSMDDAIDPIIMLNALGVNDITGIVRHAGGWGGTMLWRVTRRNAPSHLLLRVFPHSVLSMAEREAIAHQAAFQAGVPVPEVIACGTCGDHAALLLTWCPGETVADHLRRSPECSYEIGIACGETLARIHSIPGPTTLAASAHGESVNDWLSWAGPHAERLRSVIAARHPEGMPTRLLHMDYHPENVLWDTTSITAVIDWANVHIGPPFADLARSRSILRLVLLNTEMPKVFHGQLGQFEHGMRDGHAQVHGLDEDEDFFDAWAAAVQLADLEPKIGQPDVWLTSEIFATMRSACEQRIALL